MRAVGVLQFGGPEMLRMMEAGTPRAGPGQVRIRVRAATVNPADVAIRSGQIARSLDAKIADPPHVDGLEAAGVVDALGAGVESGLAVGDRVMAANRGDEPIVFRGGHAEYVVVPTASVVRSPKGASDAAAATLPMNGLTARHALDLLALPTGATVAVTGAAGAVGGYVVQLAAAEGLHVIADASDTDTELVTRLGADIVVPRGPDVAAHIRDAAPAGVDGLVDCSAQHDALHDAVRDGGRVAAVRATALGTIERGITVQLAKYTTYLEDHERLDKLREQAESGAITLRVAQTYPAEQAADAHRRLETGGTRGRLVLTF